uniref:Charged multivesicular body protein 7 n=1 Tax=Angiostrongylus cantonensis TaxID=6313 RepID=A0A0K0DIC0_ANGCA
MATKYLPSFWNDDTAMQGYMSVIKARAVNPVDYDRKIKFWTDLISSSCEVEGNAIVSAEILKRRFRRGDQIPSSILAVVEHLHKSGVLIPLSKWEEQHSSWMGWGFQRLSKTSEWLFGTSKPSTSERYIHLETIRLMKLYNREFHSEIDGTGSIVAYSTFYNSENFDIVLAHLSDRGDVTVGQGRDGEQILKFRDSNEPVRFTETDASVHDIRRAMSKIEKDITFLERKVENDCRAALRNKDKIKAANLLRQKKHVQKDISDKDSQYQRLLTMLQQLSATKHNKEILDAYKAGTAAFKANLARHGITAEKIDEMMDEVSNSIDDYREIEEAIGQAFVPKQRDDGELEKELEDLISKQKPIMSLPEVPTNTLGFREFDEDDAMSLQKRLERLRSAV